jgi:glycosyltransferase involved in cell wall biosynthesis
MHSLDRPPVLLVGNFLSGAGRNPSVSEDLARRLRDRAWPVITTSSRTGRLARLADMLTTIWQHRHDYALANVEVYSGLAFYLAEAACWMLRRAGKPYILTLHGGNLPEFAERSPRRVQRLLASAEHVTAPSRYLQELLRPWRSDIELLPNPLDLSLYPYRHRASLVPRLVWLRAFNEVYNPTLAIRVIAQLAPRFPEIQLTMLGPDKGDGSFARTQQLARELGVAERIAFPGGIAKSDVPANLAAHDLFINTTNADNTPISVLEALACGLNVVSTNVGGLPYLLEPEHTALLVSPNDTTAMASAVARLLSEPQLASHLSQTGRDTVAAFDWSHVLPRWEALFCRFAAVASAT